MRQVVRRALVAGLILAGLFGGSVTAQAQAEAEHIPEGTISESVGSQGIGTSGEVHHAPTGAPPVNWTDLGYGGKDTHGGELESGEEPMAPPLLLALLNFAIFGGILYWKAGPALHKYLANRHESIKNALEEAAKLQAEAQEKLKEYSERIADADTEVTALIDQIRRDSEAEREKIVANAEQQAERMKRDAAARIESEFIRARRQLEREVVAKAAEVAERLLAEKSSPADHKNLFSGFITDLKASDGADSKGVS